jgi:hypothetical protein
LFNLNTLKKKHILKGFFMYPPTVRIYPPFDSLSSAIIFDVTKYRNQPGCLNKCVAEGLYAGALIISTGETVIAVPLYLMTLPVFPFLPDLTHKSIRWVNSSAFCMTWSVFNLLMNPFKNILIADERSATQTFCNANFLTIPYEALT